MRVLVFGDSIAQGFWDLDGGWVARIRKYYDKQLIDGLDPDPPTVFNLGISADSSKEVLARFKNETDARARPDLAYVIAIGTNDSRIDGEVNYTDTQQYLNNLKEILNLAKNYSQQILFVGLTPCVETRTNPTAWHDISYTNDRIKEFDDALNTFCKQNNVSFVDIFGPFSEQQKNTELLPDGLHPNDIGHQMIADLVLPAIKNLLN